MTKSTTRSRKATFPRAGMAALVLLGVACLTVVPGGCGQGNPQAEENADQRLEQVARKGPVRLTLSVDPADPSDNTSVTVTIEAKAPPEVHVILTDYADLLDADSFEYQVIESQSLPPAVAGDGELIKQERLQVEFYLAGDYDWPGAQAHFSTAATREDPDAEADEPDANQPAGDAGEDDSADGQTLTTIETEGVKIHVSSSDTSAISKAELATLPTPDPAVLPEEPTWFDRYWWAVAAAGLVVVVGLVWLIRASMSHERIGKAKPVPAHEWAYQALQLLLADDLIGRSQHQDFYYRLSGIVRGYIERRYDVLAEEMTTEEFLLTMSRDHRFAADHREQLERFLTACDLVKYARYVPSQQECDHAVREAETYVEQTRAVESEAAPAAAPAGAASATSPQQREQQLLETLQPPADVAPQPIAPRPPAATNQADDRWRGPAA